ncbi:unnamed protein product [Citrullus colocynthis]|uniref:Uncharacterized protein n=1 Tax=Citrullus colocynthis TaxID=252529 RepID=A0ABP0YDP8_9ROSI
MDKVFYECIVCCMATDDVGDEYASDMICGKSSLQNASGDDLLLACSQPFTESRSDTRLSSGM